MSNDHKHVDGHGCCRRDGNPRVCFPPYAPTAAADPRRLFTVDDLEAELEPPTLWRTHHEVIRGLDPRHVRLPQHLSVADYLSLVSISGLGKSELTFTGPLTAATMRKNLLTKGMLRSVPTPRPGAMFGRPASTALGSKIAVPPRCRRSVSRPRH